MKKCPQCNTLYPDDTKFCLSDGQILISEILPLPSEQFDEEITLVRSEPIVVDFGAGAAAEKTLEYRTTPHPVGAPARPKSNFAGYVVFLAVGLLLGGALVLATLFLMRNSSPKNDAGNTRPTTADAERPKAGDEKSADPNANKPAAASARHQQKTDAGDEEFNGRVITLNAYIRSSPSRGAPEIDVLPIDDRLTITARDNANSPWFHVVCEHGTSGWMHGNTIEYTR